MMANLIYRREMIIGDLKEITWDFVLPLICLFGIFANSINFYVFSHKRELKNEIYRYLNVHSFVEILYLLFSLIHFILRRALKDYSSDGYYISKLYELLFFQFLTSMLASLSICIELIIALKRLLSIRNVNLNYYYFKSNLIGMNIFLSILLSVILNMPVFVFSDIQLVKPNSSNSYDFNYTRMRLSPIKRFLMTQSAIFRGVISPVVLLLLNLFMFIEFKKLINKKNRILRIFQQQETTRNSQLFRFIYTVFHLLFFLF